MTIFGPDARPHHDHPRRAWVVVEQPVGEPQRLEYDPASGAFRPDGRRSLTAVRGFEGAYGWVVGFGEPPGLHFDALVLTAGRPGPGDVLEVAVSGLFRRRDGDHKLLTVDVVEPPPGGAVDLHSLPADTVRMVQALYPEVGEGEGWFGAEEARAFLGSGRPTHD
ncbi:MAG: hypothetical protein P8Y13_13075 [Deinococcales bacterium]